MSVSLLSIVLLVGLAVCDPFISNYTSILIDGEEHDLVGDVVVRKGQDLHTYNANTKDKWPNGVVPYYIDPNSGYTSYEIGVIYGAMDEIQSKTGNCIKFVPRSNQRSYITFRHTNTGCNSFVGNVIKDREQQISLERPGCVQNGVAVHEIMHAIGFDHEHKRPDRDFYVWIDFSNIDPRWHGAFHKADDSSTLNLRYEYESVMHYDQYAFSLAGTSKPTIVSRWDYIDMSQVGHRKHMSDLDAQKIKTLYGC